MIIIYRFVKKNKMSQNLMLQSYALQYYQEIVNLLGVIPSDLLLLFKTNDCLRHLDKILQTPVNSTAGKLLIYYNNEYH